MIEVKKPITEPIKLNNIHNMLLRTIADLENMLVYLNSEVKELTKEDIEQLKRDEDEQNKEEAI